MGFISPSSTSRHDSKEAAGATVVRHVLTLSQLISLLALQILFYLWMLAHSLSSRAYKHFVAHTNIGRHFRNAALPQLNVQHKELQLYRSGNYESWKLNLISAKKLSGLLIWPFFSQLRDKYVFSAAL